MAALILLFRLFPPSNAIFARIGVLLLVSDLHVSLVQPILTRMASQAAKDAGVSQDKLIELFNRIERFFRRLEIYTCMTPTTAMTDMVIEIMVEVLARRRSQIRPHQPFVSSSTPVHRSERSVSFTVVTGNQPRDCLLRRLSPPDPSINYNISCNGFFKVVYSINGNPPTHSCGYAENVRSSCPSPRDDPDHHLFL